MAWTPASALSLMRTMPVITTLYGYVSARWLLAVVLHAALIEIEHLQSSEQEYESQFGSPLPWQMQPDDIKQGKRKHKNVEQKLN